MFVYKYLQLFLSEIRFFLRSRVIGFRFDDAERTKLSIISSSADVSPL